jgi:DNA invertase Pin-like site-specific DNA recombinase
MIQERVKAGMARAVERGTKSGRPVGRPSVPEGTRLAIRAAYKAGGVGMRGVAERFGVSAETVRRCLFEPSAVAP